MLLNMSVADFFVLLSSIPLHEMRIITVFTPRTAVSIKCIDTKKICRATLSKSWLLFPTQSNHGH